jgi:hypothetical protein
MSLAAIQTQQLHSSSQHSQPPFQSFPVSNHSLQQQQQQVKTCLWQQD